MPTINGTITDDGTTKTTSFTGNATNKNQTFFFTEKQNGMIFTNDGLTEVTVNANSRTYMIQSGESVGFEFELSSFNVVKKGTGAQSFSLVAYLFHSGTGTTPNVPKPDFVIEDNLTSTSNKTALSANQGRVLNEQIADSAQRIKDISVNVMDKQYGAKGDGLTSDTQAVLNAINALPNGGIIYFPKGTFIVNNVEIPSNITIKGAGRDITYIKRNTDNPVFKITGTALAGGGTPSHWYNTFEDLTIGSVGIFPSDLTQFQGVTGMSFRRMKFYAQDCRLVFVNQMWDSRFENVQFFEGGKTDGTPALELAGGLNGYKQTKETVINNCHFEGYKGSAIRTLRDGATQFKTDIITFSNLKFESKNCTGNHLNLEANNLFFSDVYVSTEFTTTDVIKMVACRGVIGKIRVGYAGTINVPTSILNTDTNCFLFDLFLTVSEPQPVNSNVWTYATDLPGVRINAQYPVINSRTFAFSQIPVGTNTIWFDSTGRLRTHSAKPTSDTSGFRITREEIGNTAQRPTSNLYQGKPYYDTSLNKPIWYTGTDWRDGSGTIV